MQGVTQADEKGHEGNTAVVTVYLCWRKRGQRNSRTGVPADHYYLLLTLYHIGTAILLSIVIYLNIIVRVQLWVAGEGPTIE